MKGEAMTKKEKRYELNRKQYQQIRKMDHNQMEQYMSTVYEQGVSAGQQQASGGFNAAVAIEAIRNIKGIGEVKLKQIRLALAAVGGAKETE